MKKIALCSSTTDWAITFANELTADSGLWFISFKDVIAEWLESGGKAIKKRQRPLGVIMPALEYLKKNYDDLGMVLFDADTLVHAEAEKEVKKEYTLAFLQPKGGSSTNTLKKTDQILCDEYSNHLEKIADVVVDCKDMKKAIAQINEILEST